VEGIGALWISICGHEGIVLQALGWMDKQFKNTSGRIQEGIDKRLDRLRMFE
jgi:hypothetical protein